MSTANTPSVGGPPSDAGAMRGANDAHPNDPHPDGILDTSVVVELERHTPSSLPIFPAISAVTLAELSVGPLVAATDQERASRQARLQLAESVFDPIPFDSEAARAFGTVAASLRANGRKPAARAYDALIAAIAISRGLPLYTLNPDDFRGIENLDVRVPEAPAQL